MNTSAINVLVFFILQVCNLKDELSPTLGGLNTFS